MTLKEEWLKEVHHVYEQMRRHRGQYHTIVNNLDIIVFPDVFSPAYFTDSAYFAKVVPEIVGKKRFLEIGTGTGVIAVSAVLNDATVVATDCNPHAVANAKENVKYLGVNVEVLEGNMYNPITKGRKFDIIFWNHPFNKGDNPHEEMLLRAGFDYQYESLEKYVAQARTYLRPKGDLLLGSGNFADIAEIERIAERNNFSLEILQEKECSLTEKSSILNRYIIYLLRNLYYSKYP